MGWDATLERPSPLTGLGAFEFNGIWAELTSGNATLSLADIEQARKTAAFARLRSSYDGIDDEYIIDLLMQGIIEICTERPRRTNNNNAFGNVQKATVR